MTHSSAIARERDLASTLASTAASSFEYWAAQDGGAIVHGFMAAPSAAVVARTLNEQGLWAIEVHCVRVRRAIRLLSFRSRRLPVAQLALGLRLLADFLESGLAVSKAIGALEELAPPAWRTVLPEVRAALRDGKSLAAAFASTSLEFPPLVVGVVRASEAGNGLASGVRRAALIMEDEAATTAALKGALAYPLILVVFGLGSLGLLVGVVLPRFAALLEDMDQVLPPTTQFVLTASAFVRIAIGPACFVLLVLLSAWRAWRSTEQGDRAWHGFILGLPALGAIRLTAGTSRICAALSALLDAGVPIAPAIQHAARAAGDSMLTARWSSVREAVIRGERMSRAMVTMNAASITAVQLTRAGEESGRLAAMLAHAARLDREEAVRKTRQLIRVVEPALILAFGSIVALVASALLQALYGIRPAP